MKNEFATLISTVCKAASNFIEKAGSRKFILMIIATHAMYYGLLPSQYWMILAMAWQGLQGGQDLVKELKNKQSIGLMAESVDAGDLTRFNKVNS